MYPPIFAICFADNGVKSKLGSNPLRLYPFGEAKQGVALPYAVWQTIGGFPLNTLTTPAEDDFSAQVDVYGSTATQVRDAAKALRDALESHAHITAWRGETTDKDTGNKRFSFDIEFITPR